MTFEEKFLKDFGCIHEDDIVGCPYQYGYEKSPCHTNGCIHKAVKKKNGCRWCWGREMHPFKPGDVVTATNRFYEKIGPAVVVETGSGTDGETILVYYDDAVYHDGNDHSINAGSYEGDNFYYYKEDFLRVSDTPMEEIISKEKLHELLMLGVE